MFMVLKRKKIIIYTTVLLFVISCYLGFNHSSELSGEKNVASQTIKTEENKELLPGEAVAVSGENNYFLKVKNDREIIRSKATELLRSILDDKSSSPESKAKAENSIINMANEMDMEVKIESLLNAKGYKENVVFISNGSVTVTVKTEKLLNEDMAKINDIVSEICGNNNIKIVEVN